MSRRRWLALAAALTAAMAAVVALDVGGLRGRLLGGAAASKFRSLAVLPVANLSGDPEQEYFADGMTDALITDLSKIGALKVISRTSVMQYKGLKKPLPEIARDLNVDTVLEGSVVREAGRVRVTAQLIEAATDRHLWAESYERELTSILKLQGEVARAVARGIKVKLRPQEATRLTGARTVHSATYEAYLRGMFHLNKSTPADLQRALDINPSLAMAHYHLAWYRVLFRLMEEAIEEHKRAKELDPFNPLHVAWLGEIYRMEKRYEEAAAEARKSIEMAPKFPPGHFVLGLVYSDKGMHDEAIAAIQKAAEASPNYRWALGLIHVAAGRPEEARKLLAELNQQTVTPWTAFWRVMLYAALGENDEAFRWLNYERPHAWVPWVRVEWCALLRNDLRFPDQLRRMNLPPLVAVSSQRFGRAQRN